MSARRRKKEPDKDEFELGPAEFDELARFQVDPIYVFEAYFRVKHRDRPGQVVPLRLRHAQKRCFDDITTIVSWSIRNKIREHNRWDALEGYGAPANIDKMKSSEQVAAIKKMNPWFVCRVLAEHEWFGLEGVRLLIGKARQQGLSTLIEAFMLWLSIITPHTDTLVMASEEKNSQKILGITHLMYDAWPDDKEGPVNTMAMRPVDLGNSRETLLFDNGSKFTVQTAGGKQSSRGFHFNRVHFSEFAYFPDASNIAAAAAGAPKHCMFFKESTANGPSGPFFEEWELGLPVAEVLELEDAGDVEALLEWQTAGQGNFIFFCSWLEEPEYCLACDEAEAAIIMGSLSDTEKTLVSMGAKPGQLKWRRWKISQLKNDLGLSDEQFFAQEFPSNPYEMFQTTARSVFDIDKVSEIENRAKLAHNLPIAFWRVDHQLEPVKVKEHEANLKIWQLPRPGAMYIGAVDPAQGLQRGDWSIIKIFDRMDGVFMEEVACFRWKTPASPLGDIAVLLCEMYNTAFLICDSNGVGQATMSRIVALGYSNVYREQRALHQEIDPELPEAWTIGCNLTNIKKNGMVPACAEGLRAGYIELRSPTSFKELRDFERTETKSGTAIRFAAPSGKSDDEVLAIVMAWHAQSGVSGAPRVTKTAIEARIKKAKAAADGDEKIWAALKAMKEAKRKKADRQERRLTRGRL